LIQKLITPPPNRGKTNAFLSGTAGLTLRSADSRELTERYLARNPGLSFVAMSGEEIIGLVMCGHDGRRGYLQHLVVKPSMRGQGIATALVRSSLAALKELGIEKTHIDVLVENSAAHRYWINAGWQKRDDIVRYSYIASADSNA
jgi:ribosomal protein S18 acetylase RimI-like enzyme